MRSTPLGAVLGTTPREPRQEDPATREQVVRMAEEFESMLVLQMLRQMRQSMLDEESEESDGLGADVFTDTFDQEVARHVSQAGGFGLKPVIVDAFERSMRDVGTTTPTSTPTPSAGTVDVASGAGGSSYALVSSVVAPTATGTGHAPEGATTPELVAGRVTSPFGWRTDPFHGRSKFHAGVDVKAAYGQPVPVVSEGTVAFAGNQGAYGLTVVVDHGGGLTTRYAHLSSLDVEAGQRVTPGQVVGLVGQTGRATGPHLHFEVRQHGEVVDPAHASARFDAAGLTWLPVAVAKKQTARAINGTAKDGLASAVDGEPDVN